MVAVIPLVGRGHNRPDLRLLDFANAHQLVTHNRFLGLQLRGIGQILIMTAATYAKMPAAGNNPLWRGLEHFQQFGAREVLAFENDPRADSLTRQTERDEYSARIGQTPHSFAAIGESGESDFDNFVH